MRKKKSRLKLWISALLGVLSLTVISTVLIGNYFVDYALLNKSMDDDHENVVDGSDEFVAKVNEIKKREKKLRDEWLVKVADQTKEVSIKSHDNLTLYGHEFLQKEETDHWFLVVHGYKSNEREAFLLARHFYEKGFNVLTVAMRAHAPSEGQFIGMGNLDRYDLFKWTEHLVQNHPNSKIIYHGTSMGGATVVSASDMDLPENVVAIIDDCGYTSTWNIFEQELKKRFNLPAFPVLYMADVMGRIRAGYSLGETSALKSVKQTDLPILFIHTTDDDFIPISMSKELYEAKKDKKELFIVEGGEHAEAKYVAGDEYYEKIFSFIKEYL